MESNISVDEAIEFFNELISTDSEAVAALVAFRVPCNRDMADHPTVQVMSKDNRYKVGFLGIINGLFGVNEDQWGHISFIYDDDGNLQKAERTEGRGA